MLFAKLVNMIAHHRCLAHNLLLVALSSVSSWRTVDGDFDYEAFWNNIVDFFEDVPGPVARRRVDKLLEWWTRYWLCSDIVCVRHLT